MPKPVVSIVLAGTHCEERIAATRRSLESQTFSDCETLVCEPDEPFATGCNRLILKAQGEFLCFAEAGDIWPSERLTRQISTLGRQLHLSWCYCGPRGSPEGHILRPLVVGNFIPRGSVMIRRSALESLAGFDPLQTSRYCAEWDLWLRVAAGHPVGLAEGELGPPIPTSADMFLGMRSVVEAAVARHPDELKHLRSEALAEIYIAAGNAQLIVDQRSEARVKFAEALTHSPLRSDAYLSWISSFLPSSAQRQIRDLHNLSRHLQSSQKTNELIQQ